MRTKLLYCLGLFLLSVVSGFGQPTNGAVYWSTTQPDCSSLQGESAVPVMNSSGATLGYSCYMAGTFLWFAAGGIWNTTIRVSAPASAPIGVDYTFYDASGNPLSMDTKVNNVASSLASSNDVNFALSADQPAEVEVLGAFGNGPSYSTTATGSVYAVFLCPDAATCNNVLPQLLYSALPTYPWSLSVPLSFDNFVWTQYSAVGINDNAANVMSLVIYNEDTVAKSYTVRVFDSTGTLIGTGTTPPIPPLKTLTNGNLGEGGTYGVYLSQVVSTLPVGVCKVLVDGGTLYSAVEVLQFNGPSATTLQVAYDTAPAVKSAIRSAGPRSLRVPAPRLVFPPLAR